MRVYQLAIMSQDRGTLLSWHPSKRAAEKAGRDEVDANGDAEGLSVLGIYAQDIPTTKAGLIDWLNAHFDTDNG